MLGKLLHDNMMSMLTTSLIEREWTTMSNFKIEALNVEEKKNWKVRDVEER